MKYSLIDACENGDLTKIKYLVENGANIHACYDDALRFAAHNGNLEVVNYLRKVAGTKWKCFECVVRAACLNICEGLNNE